MAARKRAFVFVLTKTLKGAHRNEPRSFLRLPSVGEYLTLAAGVSPVFRVLAVVHCPHARPMYAAEVYATEVPRDEWKKVEGW